MLFVVSLFYYSSPINSAKQSRLNLDFGIAPRLEGVLPVVLEKKQPVLNRASIPASATPVFAAENFDISQFRHEGFEAYAMDPFSFLAYPIMDSFQPDAKVVGVLGSAMYWRMLLASALPNADMGSFICVIENSFNQTFSYRLDGFRTVFLRDEAQYEERYSHLAVTTDLNAATRGRLENAALRSYTSVPFNTDYGQYTIRIYPTTETEAMFHTKKPWLYTWIVVAIFGFTSLWFAAFNYFVERRQRIVMRRLVESSMQIAGTERDLNEFVAHEVRNPLSSAIVAHSFITSKLESDPCAIPDDELRSSLQADHRIIKASLDFIDDFMRNMLLMYRVSANKLAVSTSPTKLHAEVIEPVRDILQPQNGKDVELQIECSTNLIVMTDRLRLKQVCPLCQRFPAFLLFVFPHNSADPGSKTSFKRNY